MQKVRKYQQLSAPAGEVYADLVGAIGFEPIAPPVFNHLHTIPRP